MRRILICLAVALPLIVAVPAQASPSLVRVQPKLETPALFDHEEGGDADVDDPAIWVHPADKSRSRVVVTAKNGGLYVYDLRGKDEGVGGVRLRLGDQREIRRCQLPETPPLGFAQFLVGGTGQRRILIATGTPQTRTGS